MFAALYGELVAHPWRPVGSEHDAYQLFHRRSLAMGWLDVEPAVPGLWGMNDAGWDHPLAAPGASLVSWFQVEAGPVLGERPLPVQPFLRCAEEVTERAGTLRLSAVQVLAPVQGLDPAVRPAWAPVPSVQAVEWFAERPPGAAVAVEVELNSGQDPSLPAVAEELVASLRGLRQDVFVLRDSRVPAPGAVLAPPFDDGFWHGPPRHRVALSGDLAEWTCDAIGWLIEVVAELAARHGVRTPLLVTVRRSAA